MNDQTTDTPSLISRRPVPRTGYGPPETGTGVPIARERVKKRNGSFEDISIAKIEQRLEKLSHNLHVNIVQLSQQIINGVYDGIQTAEIDKLSAGLAHDKITDHPDYDILAARIVVSNHHKETIQPFSEVMLALHTAGQISDEFLEVVQDNSDRIDGAIDYDRDYLFTYFGFKTFESGYGLRIRSEDGREIVYERPQHMFMRASVALHLDDLDAAIECYEWMSCQYFIPASPSLFNLGTRRQQCSSCFLVAMKEEKNEAHPDSIDKIYSTLKGIAKISKSSGGIGMHISTVRAEGSPITSAGRGSAGIIPMLKPFEATANYVDQGRKRKGAIACFVADSEIVTINRGVQKIQNVQIGDLVVTHQNRVKPVSQIHANPIGDRKIYKLKVERNKDIYVTGNHRFWSFYTNKYKNNKLSFGWNSVKELKELIDNPKTKRQTCYVAIPNGTGIVDDVKTERKIDVLDYVKLLEDDSHRIDVIEHKVTRWTIYSNNRYTNPSQSVNQCWFITNDFANLIGIWLGDGHIKMDNVKDVTRGIGFTVHKDNKSEIDFIRKTCVDVFGCNITESFSKYSNCLNIQVNSTMVGMIFNELFGCHFDGKRLHEMCFSWPKTFVESLIAGLITADGHITRKCNATLQMSNPKLITQLYHLCRINGIAASFVQGKMTKVLTCVPYIMSIPLNNNILKQTRKLYADNRIQQYREKLEKGDNEEDKHYLKILDIVETDRKDNTVYTLGVDDDHSYTVEGLICENCYLEPWHADIEDFLDVKNNTGSEARRMRDLHIAVWMCDLFMKRVNADQDWSLMCPFYSPDLVDLYGEAFEKRYQEYERMGAPYVRRVVKARNLWTRMIDAQIHNGEPYVLYKDAVNRKTNHQNLGTIRSSNLCAEIALFSDSDHTAVCNLSSISLKSFVTFDEFGKPVYDFETLRHVVKMVARNLDRIIDINVYPTKEAKRSNMRERPLGIGVQGLADAFIAMRYPFDSVEASELNKEIFETIYFAALEASCDLAKEAGEPYPSYLMNGGCPVSHGVLQFDMWIAEGRPVTLSGRWDWTALKSRIAKHGIRNSMLVALMPTASTSQLLGNTESFEAMTNNIYVRNTLAGSFKIVNQQMIRDLIDEGMWTEELKNKVVYLGGSIQDIPEIPKHIRDLYKTAFDLSQKVIIDQSADRAPFIDQTQSLNIHMAAPTLASVTSMHMYGWNKGLKTGMYYLRSQPAKRATQVTVDPTLAAKIEAEKADVVESPKNEDEVQQDLTGFVCTREEGCVSCSG